MRKAVLLAIVLLVACSPSLDTCRKLMPPAVAGEQVVVMTTPYGRTGCGCTTVDGVLVVVQPERGFFAWKRGQIWVDKKPVTEGEFVIALNMAIAKRKAEALADSAMNATERAVAKAKGLAKDFLDAIGK